MSILARLHGRAWIAGIILALALAACGGTAAGTSAPAPTTAAPAGSPTATESPSEYASPSPMASPTGSPSAGATTVLVANSSLGQILTDSQGHTLYVYKNDTANSSTCTGACAVNWPPLTVSSSATPTLPSGTSGTLSTFARSDGSHQVTYNGMPLYRFARDTAPGQTNGEGVGGVWTVAKPAS